MPIRSQKQFRFLFSRYPDLAKKWLTEFPVKYSELPRKVVRGGISKVDRGRNSEVDRGENKGQPTSAEDLLKFLGSTNRCKIIEYPDLKNYQSIEDVLEPYGCTIILYLTEENFGHWITVFRYPNSNIIEFFDPYGFFPDDEFEFASKTLQKEPYLTRLLYQYKGPLEYNNFAFQSEDENVATCGLWTVLRLLLKDLSLSKFKKLFLDLPKKYNIQPDDLVVRIFS